MRFTPQFLDELRARLPVSEVVGRRVKLKKAGREFKGLSPFQQEKSPSFTVNDQKGFYHDFSSGKHGDIISFLMETEGVGFAEAVERLASMAGMALPAVTPDAARNEQRRKSLYDVMDLAAKFFCDTLASRFGAKARGYLADRAITPATQLQFRIGYAPGGPGERFALKEFLGGQGISTEDMVEAGLLIGGDDIPVPYDRFRDRVMFPITDIRNRVIAFGGRALEKDVPAKYLNSPETPLFHKGDNLYNLAPARQATHNGAPLIVVEGYVDVIAMVTSGFGGAVAPLGTALTENQLALIWKMADEPILCFDGDRAGQKAAYRAADLALPHLKPGKSLRFALLPEGQDPDDLARSGGRAAIEEVIGAARGLADMLWSREIEGGSFATPERRAALEARIGELSNGIRDEVVRRYYRQDLAERLQRTFAPEGGRGGYGRGKLSRQFQPGRGRRIRPPFCPPRLLHPGSGGPVRPRRWSRAGVLRRPDHQPRPLPGRQSAVGQQPDHARPALGDLPPRGVDFAVPDEPPLVIARPSGAGGGAGTGASGGQQAPRRHHRGPLPATITSPRSRKSRPKRCGPISKTRGLGEILQRVERAITTSAVWGSKPGAAREDVLATWQQLVVLHQKTHALLREKKDAELALGEDPSEANMGWLRDVSARLDSLEGTEALIEGFGELSGRFRKSV